MNPCMEMMTPGYFYCILEHFASGIFFTKHSHTKKSYQKKNSPAGDRESDSLHVRVPV